MSSNHHKNSCKRNFGDSLAVKNVLPLFTITCFSWWMQQCELHAYFLAKIYVLYRSLYSTVLWDSALFLQFFKDMYRAWKCRLGSLLEFAYSLADCVSSQKFIQFLTLQLVCFAFAFLGCMWSFWHVRWVLEPSPPSVSAWSSHGASSGKYPLAPWGNLVPLKDCRAFGSEWKTFHSDS